MSPEQQGDLQDIFGSQGFDPNSVEPQSDFDVLPPGEYPVLIEAAEYKETKKGDGHYVALTMMVLDGQYKGRKLWDNINIHNPNEKTVTIALKAFGALGRAIGVEAITDTSQLLNQVIAVKAVVKKDNIYGERNAVQKYLSPTEAQPQVGNAGLPTPAAATPAQPVAAPQAAGPAVVAPVGPAASGEAPAHSTAAAVGPVPLDTPTQSPQAPWMRKAA
jgi:hypothetical protein